MKIFGVDPGTICTGYGVVVGQDRDIELIDCGVVQAPQRKPIEERLLVMYRGLRKLIQRHQPNVLAVEQPFVAQGPRKSALAVGEAHAMALLAAAEYGIPVHQYPPAKVRKTVAGYGGGGKEQVRDMVSLLLGRSLDNYPLDTSDALAVALCHTQQIALRELAGETAPLHGRKR